MGTCLPLQEPPGLFHSRVTTAVYHVPIFACCKDIRSPVNQRADNETKQDVRDNTR